jgi:hypothetical protein
MQSEMGLWVSANVFRSFNKSIQDALIDALRGTGNQSLSALNDENDEGLADLTPAQAREFITGCHAKTKDVIREIIKSDSRSFQTKNVASALEFKTKELTAVWSGITKRTGTITGVQGAKLIGWGEYKEQGWLTEKTHKSLRKAFNPESL